MRWWARIRRWWRRHVRRLATYKVYMGEICMGEVTKRRGRERPIKQERYSDSILAKLW
jgi:hypothetical protein